MISSLFCASQPVTALVVQVQSCHDSTLRRDSVIWYALDKAKTQGIRSAASDRTCLRKRTCDLPKSRLTVSPRLDQAFELRYRGNRLLCNTPVLHIQTPRDELRAYYALPSQEVSGIQLRIPMRPRDRDATHHSLDEVLRVSGEIFTSGWPV